jgi:hypothetical protein
MKQKTAIATTQTVTIGFNARAGTLSANPPVALVKAGAPLAFRLPVLAVGYSLEIDFAVANGKKGPFPRHPGDPSNPVRGRWISAGHRLMSLPSDAAGVFEYSIVIRNARFRDLAALDPMVVVKK